MGVLPAQSFPALLSERAGDLLGEHKGGFLPFEVELDGRITEGEQLLTIAVNNVIDYTTLPVGGKADMLSGMVGNMGAGAEGRKPQNHPDYPASENLYYAPGLYR